MPLQTQRAGTDFHPVDYHMHTEFTDGESTVAEYAEAARARGLSEIAITDHIWRSSEWVDDYVATVRRVDDRYDDLDLHAGLEAKVIDRDGSVDISAADAEAVDFVMGVVHRYQPEAEAPYDDICRFEADRAATLERDYTLELLANPVVDVVGHPSRTYYKFFYGDETDRPYPTPYFEEMAARSRETATPLEYNARLPARVRERLLELYVRTGTPFTLGSDAHSVERLSQLDLETVATALEGEHA